jgi:beta-lactam-binding protein with PASTA domain
MPEIVGERLDVALSDIERAGFDEEVEVLGGGTFGVLDESNWTVCSQEPVSGEEITSAPRITVDRSCTGDDQGDPEAAESDEAADDQAVAAQRKKEKKRKQKAVAAVSDTFVMPALVGMNLQEAQNRLQARGSFLLTQTDGTGQERFQMLDYNWKVCGQRPAAGTVTDVATLVELVAVKLSESC